MITDRNKRVYNSVADFQDQNYVGRDGRPEMRGFGMSEFEMSLHNLHGKYLQLSSEDIETINKIAKKVC